MTIKNEAKPTRIFIDSKDITELVTDIDTWKDANGKVIMISLTLRSYNIEVKDNQSDGKDITLFSKPV